MDDNKWNPNPTGKGGFGDHPENRSDGGWKKEDSISYQYNRFLRMNSDEIAEAVANKNGFTMAQRIALQRVRDAENSLKDAKEVTDRTEGKAPQTIYIPHDDRSPYEGLDEESLRKLAEAE